MTTRFASRRWLVLAGVLLVAAAIGGYFAWQRWGGSQVNVGRLVSIKDRAVGLAENGQYAKADELFQQLARQLPDESMIRRNLAIVRIGPLEEMKPEDLGNPERMAKLPSPEAVVQAVEALLAIDPDEAVSHILASRAARKLKTVAPQAAARLPDPLVSLQKAVSLDQTDAAVRFELYEFATKELSRNKDAQETGREAIAEAYHRQPRNMTLFLELIVTQAAAKDPALAKTLEGAADLLAPLEPLLVRKHGSGVEQYRQKAIQAVKENRWGSVNVRREIFNKLNSEIVQRTDRMRVEVGALEYLQHEFSDDFYERYGRPPIEDFPATNVRFTAASAKFPRFNDVRDLRIADVDLNGRLDVAVLHGQTLTVLARPVGQPNWDKLLETPVPERMHRLVVADLDRDEARLQTDGGTARHDESPSTVPITPEYQLLQTCQQAFPDFLLYGDGGIAIIRNEMAGKTEKTSPGGGSLRQLAPVNLAEDLSQIGNVTAACLVDFDHDQDLDLVLGVEGKGIRLWRTLAKGTFRFEDYTEWSSLPATEGNVTDLAIVDWDRDLYIDLLACCESCPPILLANQRHGQFLGRKLDGDFSALDGSKTVVPLEIDGNASWDVAGLGTNDVPAVLTTTPAPGEVRFLKQLPPSAARGQRLVTWDYDNDTHADLLVWGGKETAILRGSPSGFAALDATHRAGIPTGTLSALDFGDLDGDHDLDLVAASDGQLVQVTNDGGNANRSLIFFVTGDFNDNQRIGTNNSAIGTTVETRIRGRYQSQVITRQPVHIGLGSASEADLVRLIFTNGIPRSAATSYVEGIFCERQVLAGSCPFIYCWDGEKYAFFTDCLWAAPIGLQVAEGQMAPSRAWEYLLIPGERLKERQGGYELQLTEELWEAAYFDEVKLIAVDHPADTDLYTNEKVGGPDLAAPKLHLVHEPRRPVVARDKHGRDVLATVSKRDDVYLRGFDGHVTQGLVDEHFLELDLGELQEPPQRVTLFLTGWIYPTNTSINVNLSQHPDLAYPRHPYVQVADGKGGWQEVQAFMGFPGGKTKTIAVEVPEEVFASGDYRLRICTSAEIYWDDIFFTVDEEPIVGDSPLVKEHSLPLASAELHYRGFSRELPRHPHAPLRFDYQSVSTEPKWPPMHGNFTRYGDVRPLLANADDQMVVMGSGDEMTVRFRAPADGPPPGWKRDFILYSVGWDKDADLNTVYGQTAEPLPYNAMPSYPYPPEPGFPDTAEHRHYLETYQTRLQDHRRFWRQLVE